MYKKILKKWKLITVFILIIVIATFCYFYFFNKSTTPKITYTTSIAQKTNITVDVTVSGSVSPAKQLNAGFAVAGKISEINVKVGDAIKVGQTLAKIDPTSLQNTVNQSQSSLNVAKNNLQNKYIAGKYTYYDIANLNESIKSAQDKLNSDIANLNASTLTSTIDGIVISVNNNIGDSVSASGSNSTVSTAISGVITIIDPNSLNVNLTVGETDISKIKIGQLAQISFDALGDKKYVGQVQSVDMNATVSSNVVSYGVKILISKPDGDIKLGMTANATIATQSKDNVLAIPNSAVKSLNGQKYVQVLQNGNPVNQNITIGIANDSETEILTGLNEGDSVISATISSSTTSVTPTSGNSLFSIGGNRPGGATNPRGN